LCGSYPSPEASQSSAEDQPFEARSPRTCDSDVGLYTEKIRNLLPPQGSEIFLCSYPGLASLTPGLYLSRTCRRGGERRSVRGEAAPPKRDSRG
jgi:hypothetical protein